jgi:hypothetical protein
MKIKHKTSRKLLQWLSKYLPDKEQVYGYYYDVKKEQIYCEK